MLHATQPRATMLAIAAAGLLALAAGDGLAQSRTDSGSARLSVAGKLRLEAEVVNRLACEAMRLSGSARTPANEALLAAEAEFERLLAGLRDGDLALGLREAEGKRRVLDKIAEVEAGWRAVEAGARNIADGASDAETLSNLLSASAVAEQAVQDLLAVLAGSYSSSESFSYQASLALNVLVREKVLLTEIATLQCLVASGFPGIGAEAQLAMVQQAETFEKSLDALISGQPAIGIMAPPTEVVKSTLERVAALWQEVKPGLAAADGLAREEDILRELENAEILYLLATSQQPDLYRVPLEQYTSEELRRWLREPLVAEALRAQNARNVDLTEAEIVALDDRWRAERGTDARGLIDEMLARPLSQYLLDRQNQTAGLVTEVFVMDNKGLNVGQSKVTSDLWQGDEAKWQETYATPEADMHVSEVEFDDSTGFYQVQVSLPISDPDTGSRIGAVTFGVNIQSLL